MKRTAALRIGMLWLACLGMLIPAPLLQAAVAERTPGQQVGLFNPSEAIWNEPHPNGQAGTDVELRPGGVLVGQVVDSSGTPMAAVRVSLRLPDREVAAAVTDRVGSFSVSGLGGGTYEIVAGQARDVYRVWVPGTAPPQAQSAVLITPQGHKVRGQGGPIAFWLSNPWVVAGLVAAAVTVPVVIHNHRLDRTAAPTSP
jgi:hypothetical protein